MRLGPISRRDRPRLAELLAATGAFNDDEVQVALGLFDVSIDTVSSRGATPRRDPLSPSQDSGDDYEFLGAFDEQSDQLIGYACFGRTPATDGTYDLYWLAVDPA